MPCLPGFQERVIISPREMPEFLAQWLFRHCWKIIQQMMRKFPPAEFRQKLGIAPRSAWHIQFFGVRSNCLPNLPRGNFTEMQMWRKPRSPFLVGTISHFAVIRKHIVQESIYGNAGTRGSRTPLRAKSASPIDFRLQFPGISEAETQANWQARQLSEGLRLLSRIQFVQDIVSNRE